MALNGTKWHNFVSQLLKVVETSTWAQKMRNMHVYISTYNILKLYLLRFPRKSQKTVAVTHASAKILTSLLKVVETSTWA